MGLSHLTKAYTPELYKDVLNNKKTLVQEMVKIRSCKHRIFTEKYNKISLCSTDDKSHLLDDGYKTLAWGHYKITELSTNRSDQIEIDNE